MGIPGLLLMESAGRGIAEALVRDEPALSSRIVLVLCGPGNNGGDGPVIARHLRRMGIDVEAILLAKAGQLTGVAALNLRAARASGVPVTEAVDEGSWSSARTRLGRGEVIVVDALLGTGVRGGARGVLARAIEDLNASGLRVYSVDVPSGIDLSARDTD